MRHFAFVLLLILVKQTSMAAECTNMQFQTAQTNIDFTTSLTVQPTITVKANTHPGPCDFFITFDYGTSTSATGRSLKAGSSQWPFQLYKNSSATQILKRFPNVSSNSDVVTGYLADGSSDRQVNVSYWAILNTTNPWLRFGNYTETITANLYRGTISSYTFVESRSISFNYNAPKRVDISLVATGAAFNINDTTETMNFGTISSGASRSADVIVKYNAGYTLYASSANNGRLKHQTQNQYIPYSITFRGTSVNLNTSSSSPVQVFREFGTSPASGLVIPVTATIGTVSVSQTGTYQDTITLTVQSSE
ncbi:spore coat protein U domain-containing protein [Bdellovibrio sp. BCCA]|uniref:spore coat protein U domain-containing protein n=1 Tax=Bdellovibrio sp. BCCA TaxID=3136281 RepID=UPI0030F0B5C6